MRSTEAARDVLVDPDWITERLNDPSVRVVEVDVSAAAYDAGHIEGASLWNAYGDMRDSAYTPIDAHEFESLASRTGLTPETTVVLYGYAAHLGFWLLKRHGHPSVRLMDGSRDRWTQTGHAASTTPAKVEASSYSSAGRRRDLDVRFDELLRSADGLSPVILDVRSAEEFCGEYFWPSGATEGAGRAGHIPGAVHIPIDTLRDQDGEYKTEDELRAVLAEHGVVPERPVVTYCTIGNRAAQAWFALTYLLDFPDVRVYGGSWAEWGTLPDSPVAT